MNINSALYKKAIGEIGKPKPAFEFYKELAETSAEIFDKLFNPAKEIDFDHIVEAFKALFDSYAGRPYPQQLVVKNFNIISRGFYNKQDISPEEKESHIEAIDLIRHHINNNGGIKVAGYVAN